MKTAVFALIGVLAAGPVMAEPLAALQRAAAAAQKTADERAAAHERLHRDTLAALKKGAGAFAIAEGREKGNAIAELQAATALRRAHQDLADAVTGIVGEAEALEQAAGLAARGEVAPSATDHLVCDGPDCAPVPEHEHAAMVQMGAVPPSFDMNAWPSETAMPLALLAVKPAAPLSALRTAAEHSANAAHDAAVRVEEARRALTDDAGARGIYAAALEANDAARRAQDEAAEKLRAAVEGYGAAARAARRAALMAGDGYRLARGGHKACRGDAHGETCVTAEGLEAAAFLVIGAAEDINDAKSLAGFVTRTPEGLYVFK